MPLIQVKVIEGVFSPEEKQQVIRKFTDAIVAIEGEKLRPVTWVVVEEVRSGEWGIGGQAADHGGWEGTGGREIAEPISLPHGSIAV